LGVSVRLTHWLLVLSIVVLSVTGFYIGALFFPEMPRRLCSGAHAVFVHFVACLRLYRLCRSQNVLVGVAGNSTHALNQFIPTTKGENRQYGTVRVCSTPSVAKDLAARPGAHGPCRAFVISFCSAFTSVDDRTGFAMYKEAMGGGILWTLMGGWSPSIMMLRII